MDPKTDAFLEALDSVLGVLQKFCKNQSTCNFCPFFLVDSDIGCSLRCGSALPDDYRYTADGLYKEA